MKKTKKIIKQALKQPELYTEAELQYFHLIRQARKQRKQKKKLLGMRIKHKIIKHVEKQKSYMKERTFYKDVITQIT